MHGSASHSQANGGAKWLNWPLLALAIGAFGIGTTECIPMGLLPVIAHGVDVSTRPTVLLAMATTVMGAGAMFTLYTYVAPVLADLTGASDTFVTIGLVLIGVGFTIGNGLGGRLADWSLDDATKIFLAALALIMVVLPFVLTSHAGAAIGLLLGDRYLRHRSSSPDAGHGGGGEGARSRIVDQCRRLQFR